MKVGFADLPFVARAAFELVVSRLTLALASPERLTGEVALDEPQAGGSTEPLPRAVEQVSYYIPRVAARMPFKADCLVQALAARRWLSRLGIRTELFLGVRQTGRPFEAHAWLKWEGNVVTGGPVDDYSQLRRSTR